MKVNKKWIILVCLLFYIIFIIYRYEQRQEVDVGEDQSIKISTSFYPVYIHTKALTTGIDVEVVNIASPTVGCLHDYQLTVKDMKEIESADVLIMNGLGAEQFDLGDTNQKRVVDSSVLWQQMHQEEDHSPTHNHHEDEGHVHENSHIWMSLEGSKMQVQAISKALQKHDPDHAEAYKVNMQKYIKEIEALEEEAKALKETLKGQKAVAVHDTIDYLAESFGIELVATLETGEHSSLSPKALEAIIKTMKEENVNVIFTEAQYEHLGALETLREATESQIYIIDTMVTQKDGYENTEFEYVERMKENMKLLKEAYNNE